MLHMMFTEWFEGERMRAVLKTPHFVVDGGEGRLRKAPKTSPGPRGRRAILGCALRPVTPTTEPQPESHLGDHHHQKQSGGFVNALWLKSCGRFLSPGCLGRTRPIAANSSHPLGAPPLLSLPRSPSTLSVQFHPLHRSSRQLYSPSDSSEFLLFHTSKDRNIQP